MAKSNKNNVKGTSIPSVKKSVKKKKLKNKLKNVDPSAIEMSVKSQNKSAQTGLDNIKNSGERISSNWKEMIKNMKSLEAEEKQSEQSKRPAFLRRNKAGQIITNQKMNHPKAVLVGRGKKKTEKEKTVEGSEIWFDDVDPVLLEHQPQPGSGDGLVKAAGFQGQTRVLGMDCEMVGVGRDGQDSILARVSIVNHFGHVLYDKFVAPREKVTDYRTAVSGVRPEDLEGAPEFKQVQAEVAELIKDRILVGHALHHDLKVRRDFRRHIQHQHNDDHGDGDNDDEDEDDIDDDDKEKVVDHDYDDDQDQDLDNYDDYNVDDVADDEDDDEEDDEDDDNDDDDNVGDADVYYDDDDDVKDDDAETVSTSG